jgi:hypothetical protein
MVLGFFLFAVGGLFVYMFTVGLYKEATKKGGGTYEIRYRDSQTIIDEQKWLDEKNGA